MLDTRAYLPRRVPGRGRFFPGAVWYRTSQSVLFGSTALASRRRLRILGPSLDLQNQIFF